MDVALGSAATGVFTNSDWLWEQLHKVFFMCCHIVSVCQPFSWLTLSLCMCACVVGQCCDRWQSVADASVPALHQTGDWQPAGRPQQHRQVQQVRNLRKLEDPKPQSTGWYKKQRHHLLTQSFSESTYQNFQDAENLTCNCRLYLLRDTVNYCLICNTK